MRRPRRRPARPWTRTDAAALAVILLLFLAAAIHDFRGDLFP